MACDENIRATCPEYGTENWSLPVSIEEQSVPTPEVRGERLEWRLERNVQMGAAAPGPDKHEIRIPKSETNSKSE